MIHVFEKALAEDVCDILIKKFDDHAKEHTDQEIFDQYELADDDPMRSGLIKHVNMLGTKYLDLYDKERMTPKTRAFENFRIKRYDPGKNHSFPWHIDAANKESCTRYLAFLFYLNDSEAGTIFKNATVEAIKGNCLCFPPMWMFPHEGVKPKYKPKYIMSTYYHFVSREVCDLKR